MRTASGSPRRSVGSQISRFPCKERTCMPGSLTPLGRTGTCDGAPARVAFRASNSVGTQD